MREMLEHPEISCCLRTGYPSWIKDRDLDVDEDEAYDEEDFCDEE